MQEVDGGSTEKTLQIIAKQMSLLGCPTWSSRFLPTPGLFSVFGFSLDSGSDNVGSTKHIVSTLSQVGHVGIISVFCFLHQYHLLIKSFFVQLDAFTFSSDSEKTTYASGVATIASVRRAPGIAKQLARKATSLYDESVAQGVCGKTPGRAIRTRRGR